MELLEILEHLVNIESVNDPLHNKKASPEIAYWIRDYLSKIGLPAEIIEDSGYYNILGIVGEGDPKLMFLAHYDTVPVDYSKWKTDPFKLAITDGRAYGRGALDDKGNIAAIIKMLEKINIDGIKGTLIYAFTGDEEVGGGHGARTIRDKLFAKNIVPNYLVNCDGHGMKIIARRRAAFNIVITVERELVEVKGKRINLVFEAKTPIKETRHAAYFLPGVDHHPLIAASHYLRTHNNLHVSKISGKFIKSNVIPGQVEVEFVEPDPQGDLIIVDEGLRKTLEAITPLTRTPIITHEYSDYGVNITPNVISVEEKELTLVLDVRAMIKNTSVLKESFTKTLENTIPKAKMEIRGKPLYLYTPKESELVRKASETLIEIDIKPFIVEAAGASDSRYYSPHGIQAFDFGPNGGNLHGPNEYVELNSLEKTSEFYMKLASKILA